MKPLIHQFLDFAASKPADEEYDWSDIDNCALVQFEKHIGVDFGLSATGGRFEHIACDEPHTFGALATRLRAEIAK